MGFVMTAHSTGQPARRRRLYLVVVLAAATGAVTGVVTATALTWRPVIAGIPVGGWVLVVAAAVTLTASLDWVTSQLRVRLGPARGGFAGGAEIDTELSRRAVRRIGGWTRPTLRTGVRHRLPISAFGFSVHRHCGRRVWVPWEASMAVLAPSALPEKRRVPAVLAAPGAVLVTGTTAELSTRLAEVRHHRRDGGRTVFFDLTGTSDSTCRWRWSLLGGCADPVIAESRAAAMIAATSSDSAFMPPGLSAPNATVERRARALAVTLLCGYLVAAVSAGEPGIDQLLAWVTARGPHPDQLVAEPVPPASAAARRHGYGPVEWERAWRHVEAAVRPLREPRVRELCTATAGDEDLPRLITSQTALCVVGPPSTASVLTALASAWIDAAHACADNAGGRLDPPAVAALSDLADLTPIPELPSIIRTAGSHGVLIHWSAGSFTALAARYGLRASELLVATTTLDVRAGLTDSSLLGWLAWRATHLAGSPRRPLCTATTLRGIPAGRAVLIHRDLGPLRTRPRRDWN